MRVGILCLVISTSVTLSCFEGDSTNRSLKASFSRLESIPSFPTDSLQIIAILTEQCNRLALSCHQLNGEKHTMSSKNRELSRKNEDLSRENQKLNNYNIKLLGDNQTLFYKVNYYDWCIRKLQDRLEKKACCNHMKLNQLSRNPKIDELKKTIKQLEERCDELSFSYVSASGEFISASRENKILHQHNKQLKKKLAKARKRLDKRTRRKRSRARRKG